jgi:hypothetical protein
MEDGRDKLAFTPGKPGFAEGWPEYFSLALLSLYGIPQSSGRVVKDDRKA